MSLHGFVLLYTDLSGCKSLSNRSSVPHAFIFHSPKDRRPFTNFLTSFRGNLFIWWNPVEQLAFYTINFKLKKPPKHFRAKIQRQLLLLPVPVMASSALCLCQALPVQGQRSLLESPLTFQLLHSLCSPQAMNGLFLLLYSAAEKELFSRNFHFFFFFFQFKNGKTQMYRNHRRDGWDAEQLG